MSDCESDPPASRGGRRKRKIKQEIHTGQRAEKTRRFVPRQKKIAALQADASVKDSPTTRRESRSKDRSKSVSYLNRLHEKAKLFLEKEGGNVLTAITRFYRNKPNGYFENIRSCHQGKMHPYQKDVNGDSHSPINRRPLKGLFFSGNLDKDGNLPDRSPFGKTRFLVNTERLFSNDTNIYFTDFYCNNEARRPHYVTVVLTKPGSEADNFCKNWLLPLDRHDNPYLQLDLNTRRVKIAGIHQKLWVEIYYTETINLTDGTVKWGEDVQPEGTGQSSIFGIPKNEMCPECFLFFEPKDSV